MGVLDYFTGSSPDDRRREEVRTGAVAPDRSERKRCWEARDKYFACLDRHDVIDPVSGEGKVLADKNCAAEDVVFGQDCATAWVCPFSFAPPLPFLSRGLCGESWVEMWSGRWKAEVKSLQKSGTTIQLANLYSHQVAYFKKFRVAEYQKKKTLERLQREGANNMGADSAVKR